MPFQPYLLVFINSSSFFPTDSEQHILGCENPNSYLQDYTNSGFAYHFSKPKSLGGSSWTFLCLVVKNRTQFTNFFKNDTSITLNKVMLFS